MHTSTHEMLTPNVHVDDLHLKNESHTLDIITKKQESPTLNIFTHDQDMAKSRDIKKNHEEDLYINCELETSCEGISKGIHEE